MGRTRRARTWAGFAVAVVGLPSLAVLGTQGASAAPPSGDGRAPGAAGDELPNPLEAKRRALRDEALSQVLYGESQVEQRGVSEVVNLGATETASSRSNGRAGSGGKDRYVELSRQTTDEIFVVLAEFGDQRHPNYPDRDTDPETEGPTRFDGPLHNQIPAPDRRVDNSTVWQADYSRQHYQDLYFGTGNESVKAYYERQSSGRYSVDGYVSDWVKVPYNEARYGRSDGFPCASNVCSNTWALVRDSLNTWYANQLAAGRTADQIKAQLATFDQWDRYDYDADGDFNESDGYLDHFQVVHAGGDQADGDPIQGEDAIWSHRWYAYQPDPDAPDGPPLNQLGGTQIGDTGFWVGDYTVQPENGGMSVFAHEYGHDLGLPDLYDTDTGGPSPAEWWSIMAQSRVSARNEPLGVRAADFGPWEKFQLGWLDYEVVVSGDTRTLELGPHEYNSSKAQAAIVVLPKKEVTAEVGAPYEGDTQWYSTSGNDLDVSMTTDVDVPAGTSAVFSFQTRYNIEDCGDDPCDYAYVEVDDGSGWVAVTGSITHPEEGDGIDGVTDGWVPATFDLSAYAGTPISLRIRYVTDPAVAGTDPDVIPGIFVDDTSLTVDGTEVFADGGEDDATTVWELDGFVATGTTRTTQHENYYIASNREYVSYDKYLRTGPYNFGWISTRPDFVEHFPYQDGLLIWYWDTSQGDNNVSVHPGEGLIMAIDSHPRAIYRLDGQPWRSRIQLYDAPFGTQKADSFTLHVDGRPSYIRGQAAQPLFDDSRSYFDPAVPEGGVLVPDTNTRIRVLSEHGTSVTIRIAPG